MPTSSTANKTMPKHWRIRQVLPMKHHHGIPTRRRNDGFPTSLHKLSLVSSHDVCERSSVTDVLIKGLGRDCRRRARRYQGLGHDLWDVI